MQQQIELEEETCMELKQVFANLQQQVEFKREKLKRLYTKLQSMRQEIKDNHDEYLRERQELVEANDDVSLYVYFLFYTMLFLNKYNKSDKNFFVATAAFCC